MLRGKAFVRAFKLSGRQMFQAFAAMTSKWRTSQRGGSFPLLSSPAVEQRLEQQIPARLRLCSVQCRLHHRRGPEKRAPWPPKSVINHRFPFRGKLLICSFVFPFLSGALFSGKLQLPLCSILWPIRRVACAYLMYCERCPG